MSRTVISSKEVSESVRISSEVKKRLQEYSRQHKQPLRRVLDKAVGLYMQEQGVRNNAENAE